jgi:lipid II:glycine glycyltransferase (peptidoglycan interpeptide bridge formation enzyme)
VHWRENGLILDEHFLSVKDPEKWNHILCTVGAPDTYFTADYHRLSEIDSGRRALAYFHQVGDHALFHPFLIEPVPGHLEISGTRCYDIESCYGYSGPRSTTDDPEILRQLWDPYLKWSEAQRVVAEVTKFHPLLRTHRFATEKTRLLHNRDTVLLNLSLDMEQIWASYPATQQRKIRQARRNGLICRVGEPEDLNRTFLPVYKRTMAHVGAANRYLFSADYFAYLTEHLANDMDLLIVEKGHDVLAAAVFFKGAELYHYHLGGSIPEARNYRPNNLLLHEAAMRAKQLGFSKMHLGGGRTAASDDALFKFKASFSNMRAEFYIGETIHQPAAYEAICQRWLASAQVTQRPAPLLFYRIPPSHRHEI